MSYFEVNHAQATVSSVLLYNQKDGLSNLTFLYTVVAYLPA